MSQFALRISAAAWQTGTRGSGRPWQLLSSAREEARSELIFNNPNFFFQLLLDE
jgi:hypothetical protein